MQVADSPLPCLLNRVATGRFIAGIATRHAKETADRERTDAAERDGYGVTADPISSAEVRAEAEHL